MIHRLTQQVARIALCAVVTVLLVWLALAALTADLATGTSCDQGGYGHVTHCVSTTLSWWHWPVAVVIVGVTLALTFGVIRRTSIALRASGMGPAPI